MNSAFATDCLADALKDKRQLDDVPLSQQHIGDLLLPTGHLVACDPMLFGLKQEPFSRQFPRGKFPVLVSVATIAGFEFVAYAAIRFSKSSPVRWDILTVGDEDATTLRDGEYFGYPVDTGTGCFVDYSVSRVVKPRSRGWREISAKLTAEMENPEMNHLNGFNVQVGPVNLIAFSSGYGDGIYGTFAGFDTHGNVCAVVTDFGVVPARAGHPS